MSYTTGVMSDILISPCVLIADLLGSNLLSTRTYAASSQYFFPKLSIRACILRDLKSMGKVVSDV